MIRFLCGAAILVAVGSGGAGAALLAPAPGVYSYLDVITSVSAGCQGPMLGTQSVGHLWFGGAGNPGSTLWQIQPSLPVASSLPVLPGPSIDILVLPAMPVKDGGTSNGAYARTTLPASTTTIGTMGLAIHFGSANLFLRDEDFDFGNCEEVHSLALTRDGK